jgi:excisionase family DNA binding protein
MVTVDEMKTLPQVAKMLQVSRSQVRRLMQKGGLPYYQYLVRGTLFFDPAEVKAWVKSQKKEV